MREPTRGPATFEEKIGHALDAVYDGALLLTGDPERAESLVMSVVVDAARRRVGRERGARGTEGAFSRWVAGLLVRHYLGYVDRADGAESGGPGATFPEGNEAANLAGDLAFRLEALARTDPDRLDGLVRDAMVELPVRERAALWLVNVMECSYREAAGALGVEPGTVRDLLFRARRSVQSRLARTLSGDAASRGRSNRVGRGR